MFANRPNQKGYSELRVSCKQGAPLLPDDQGWECLVAAQQFMFSLMGRDSQEKTEVSSFTLGRTTEVQKGQGFKRHMILSKLQEKY